jgi:hypothetical protein
MREIHVGRLIDHVHLRASDLAAAKRFYRAVLGAFYFAAFLLDPDGNNVEAVYHGPGQRSADSVVIRA